MAIMISNWWDPNTSGAYGQLVENLVGLRNVMREAGWTADVATLTPGGGGPIGETGLVANFESWDDYHAAMDGEPDPKVAAHQQAIKTSDSTPVRSTTMVEMQGTEIAYDDLPRNLVQVSYIAPMPGKMPDAMADVAKSQQIFGRIGIKVRAMQAMLANPWPAIAFIQFYESAQARTELSQALFADDEWNSHFANSAENRQIVRQSAYRILP